MRRRPGEILPLEAAILDAGQLLHRAGSERFHGFALAKTLVDQGGSATLTSHGTLYKALGRLEARALLASEWEDAEAAAAEGRPRRRLYRLTGAGALALAEHRAAHPPTAEGIRGAAWETP